MFGRFTSQREHPSEATLDMPGVNGNPPGAIIRGEPTPLSQDTREAAVERGPLAAKAARYKADAGIAEQFDAPSKHDRPPIDALTRLEHVQGQAADSQLPATISVKQVASLMRMALADMGIAPTAIQGISDRLQTTELVLARDMTDQRDAIDDQHDRLVRMERDFARLAETIKLAERAKLDATTQLDLIRELLGCKEGDDVVAAVRKRLRWEKPVPNTASIQIRDGKFVNDVPEAAATS